MNNITDISVDFLKENNIKALLLDIDNTLSVAHSDKTLRDGVPEFLEQMKQNGISLIILSNAKSTRAKLFADGIGLPLLGLAAKPLPFGYIKAARRLRVKRSEAAIVGDQIFTDILGGKLAGVKTIWVTDITPEDKISFKIKRYFEKKLKKRWK